MQTVIYETLLLRQRKAMHGLVGRAIEALYADRLEEHYEALAHHYGQSDDEGKAIRYLELAGDKAAAIFSLREARKSYRVAIDLVDGQLPSQEVKRARIALSLKWAEVSHYAAT